LLVKKYGASVFAADLWISPIINANQHVHSLLKGVGGSGLDSESQCSPAPV
jgi:hypothetical protein